MCNKEIEQYNFSVNTNTSIDNLMSSIIPKNIKKFVEIVLTSKARKAKFYSRDLPTGSVRKKYKNGRKKSSHAATVLNMNFECPKDICDDDDSLKTNGIIVSVNENFPTSDNDDDYCAERRHPVIKELNQRKQSCEIQSCKKGGYIRR